MKKLKKKEINFIKNDLKDITDKVVIVTGANSGVGFAICDTLLSKNAHIVMACRNPQRAEFAKLKLLENHPEGKIDILLYSQSSILDCKTFAKNIMEQFPSFYALVLNAGIIGKKNEELYEDEITNTIGTNYISVVSIVKELKNVLDNSEEEHRIIFQGSVVARTHKYKKNQIFGLKHSKFTKYNISKCGVLNAFKYFAMENKNPNTFYLYAEPGITNSNIIRNFNHAFQKVGYWFMNTFLHSTTCGSFGACYLACNYVANGDAYIPSHCFHTRGLPTKYDVFEKLINVDIIEDAKALFKE